VYYVQIGGTPRNASFGTPALTVFNSHAVRAQFPWVEHATVLHPPIDADAYRTTPGEAITLVNLNAIKGAATFYALAERLPDRRFLGVRGWGEQEIPDPVPANVTIVGPVADMRSVYGQTRILLVPSVYEAYGRVALEAAASGIPTIAHPTPGVEEAMGDAAIYVDRDDIAGWQHAIQRLDEASGYSEWSCRAMDRCAQLAPDAEIADLERLLVAVVAPGSNATRGPQ
jgi:glycosyltransferase involved in cell wall biosynthesis